MPERKTQLKAAQFPVLPFSSLIVRGLVYGLLYVTILTS